MISPKTQSKGGAARARKLSPEKRSEIARQGAIAKWGKAREAEEASDRALAERIVRVEKDEIWTDSLVVASVFGRRHDNVLRSLDELINDGTLEHALDFEEMFVEVIVANGASRPNRVVKLTERGFMIAMPFIGGAKSRAGQKRLVVAFEALRSELDALHKRHADLAWQTARSGGKQIRKSWAGGVEAFVSYAKTQGSQNAEKYYANITKMEYKALFLLDGALGASFRDTLTTMQNIHLATAESIAEKALFEGVGAGMPYKDIYVFAKDKVVAFAALVGRTLPGKDSIFAPRPKEIDIFS